MTDKESLKQVLMESIEILSITNELLKIETMSGVDYSEVLEDLKWNKLMLRNRLDSLKELCCAETQWKTGKDYLEKLNE